MLPTEDERERLVRSWIAPHGRSIHLEIGGKQVLAMSTDILENRWYHFCLSWENQAGLYGLWINGQLWAQGHSDEVRRIFIYFAKKVDEKVRNFYHFVCYLLSKILTARHTK